MKKEIEMCINSAIFPGFIFIYTSEMWNVDHHEPPPPNPIPEQHFSVFIRKCYHNLFVLNLELNNLIFLSFTHYKTHSF